MAETRLFVYGTLRHDQPEHALYCRGVTSWLPARVRGRLARIPEGYLLLVVPPQAILHRATAAAVADESRRKAIDDAAANAAAASGCGDGWTWIEGELLTLADASAAWPLLDEWEGFRPEQSTVYQRCVIPVQVGDVMRAAWAYVTTR